MKKYYTVNEVAEILGCDRRTVIAALARGQFEYIKIGRQYRIPVSAMIGKNKYNLNVI